MSEFFKPTERFEYDTAQQRLIIGNAAYEDAIEAGTHPADIVSLEYTLADPTYQPEKTDVKLDVENWNRDDYLAFGRWLNAIVTIPLKTDHLERAYLLGVGPEPQRLYRKDRHINEPRFKGFGDFFHAIDAKDTIYRYGYDHWSFSDLMEYVTTTADALAGKGIRPTVRLFDQAAREGSGPSNEVVKRIANQPIGSLLDMAGYPNTSKWTENDFIEWGIKFTEANNRLPYHGGIQEVSKRFRGPSDKAIHRRFGGILSYQTIVADAFDTDKKHKDEMLQAKLDVIQLETEQGKLPIDLADLKDYGTILQTVAQYRIIHHLFGDKLSEKQKVTISQIKKPDIFIKNIQKHDSTMTEADIETTALLLEVFDDIWSFDNHMAWLRVLPKDKDN